MRLTIFTPTYKRDKMLSRIFNVLKSLSKFDFEWLIINDGSDDDTDSVVDNFINERSINIRYIKKENGGKPSAFNSAIANARGDYFVCCDDDDILIQDSFPAIYSLMDKLDGMEKLGGFSGRSVSPNGDFWGKGPKDFVICDTMTIRDKYGFWGEPEFYKTKILKNYSFPIFENEKFITEAVLFDVLSKEYNVYYTNIPMMVKEFLSDGLTDNQLKIRLQNPKGTIYYYNQRIRLTKHIKGMLRAVINYCRFARHFKKRGVNCRLLHEKRRLISLITYPVTLCLVAFDKAVIKKKNIQF